MQGPHPFAISALPLGLLEDRADIVCLMMVGAVRIRTLVRMRTILKILLFLG